MHCTFTCIYYPRTLPPHKHEWFMPGCNYVKSLYQIFWQGLYILGWPWTCNVSTSASLSAEIIGTCLVENENFKIVCNQRISISYSSLRVLLPLSKFKHFNILMAFKGCKFSLMMTSAWTLLFKFLPLLLFGCCILIRALIQHNMISFSFLLSLIQHIFVTSSKIQWVPV